jgi:HD-GYP domain-containing protein (c-di-GMP phosphodiesterase class II)
MAGSAEELIYRADMAMYWAKSTGKNRVGDWDGLLSRRTDGSMPQYLASRDGKIRDAVVSLVSALAAKDPVTRDHTERCSWYTGELAEALGLTEEETSVLRLASLLHDIGKLVVPAEVLCKPGPLTAEEWAQMREHPTTALHILGPIDSTADAVPAILHHHEHFEGSGYPGGLAGSDIPIASRIPAACSGAM